MTKEQCLRCENFWLFIDHECEDSLIAECHLPHNNAEHMLKIKDCKDFKKRE